MLCRTCDLLQSVLVHVGVEIAAKHVCAPGLADRLGNVPVVRQPHHVSDLKLAQLVVQVVLSCG